MRLAPKSSPNESQNEQQNAQVSRPRFRANDTVARNSLPELETRAKISYLSIYLSSLP